MNNKLEVYIEIIIKFKLKIKIVYNNSTVNYTI